MRICLLTWADAPQLDVPAALPPEPHDRGGGWPTGRGVSRGGSLLGKRCRSQKLKCGGKCRRI